MYLYTVGNEIGIAPTFFKLTAIAGTYVAGADTETISAELDEHGNYRCHFDGRVFSAIPLDPQTADGIRTALAKIGA